MEYRTRSYKLIATRISFIIIFVITQIWNRISQWFFKSIFTFPKGLLILNYFEFDSSVVLEKNIIKNASPIFYSFEVFSSLNKDWSSISAIYICLSIEMLCAKFGWNWPSGFREEVKNVKSLQTDRRMTDEMFSELLTWTFDLLKKASSKKTKELTNIFTDEFLFLPIWTIRSFTFKNKLIYFEHLIKSGIFYTKDLYNMNLPFCQIEYFFHKSSNINDILCKYLILR